MAICQVVSVSAEAADGGGDLWGEETPLEIICKNFDYRHTLSLKIGNSLDCVAWAGVVFGWELKFLNLTGWGSMLCLGSLVSALVST